MNNQEIAQMLENLQVKFERIVDHAKEQYPHFESERGQEDIKDCEEGLSILQDLIFILKS